MLLTTQLIISPNEGTTCRVGCGIPKAPRSVADAAEEGAGTGSLCERALSVRRHGAAVRKEFRLLTCWHGQMASVAPRSNVARRGVDNWGIGEERRKSPVIAWMLH
jgi:hypothetical protein